MSRATRTTPELFREALSHLERALVYGRGDLDDQLTLDAICMRISAGIEVLARVTEQDRERCFGDSWAQMWGMRNRIAHGYLLVDHVIVVSTLERDLPGIVAGLHEALDTMTSGPECP